MAAHSGRHIAGILFARSERERVSLSPHPSGSVRGSEIFTRMAGGGDFRKSCNHDEGVDTAPNNLGKKNEASNGLADRTSVKHIMRAMFLIPFCVVCSLSVSALNIAFPSRHSVLPSRNGHT